MGSQQVAWQHHACHRFGDYSGFTCFDFFKLLFGDRVSWCLLGQGFSAQKWWDERGQVKLSQPQWAMTDIADYTVNFYNSIRLHSTLGNLLPVVFEHQAANKNLP